MLGRRMFLGRSAAGWAGLALGGCARPAPAPPVEPLGFAIDVHSHVFNALDVPTVGFIEQVFLRDEQAKVVPVKLRNALVRLLAHILLPATSTARQELDRLAAGGFEAATVGSNDPRKGDRDRVAAGIAAFAEGAGQRFRTLPGDRAADQALLQLLLAEVAPDAVPTGTEAALAPRAMGSLIADSLYGFRMLEERGFTPGDLASLILWAGLMTRDRMAIAAELARLYRPAGVRIFCPALVDFDYWLKGREPRLSPQGDQIAVMAEVARRTRDVLLLNFVGFCPLRAQVEGTGATLGRVQDAVLKRGFAGVKLYPPAGFRPLGNAGLDFRHARVGDVDGAGLDRALRALYGWCADNDVPILAHAANSNAAGPCTGRHAGPAFWRPVLDAFAGLRVDLAHFGGFEEGPDGPQGACGSDSPRSWEEEMAATMQTAPGLYADLGYWSELFDPGAAGIRGRLRALWSAHRPVLAGRLMFGTDWSMIGAKSWHPDYIGAVQQALQGAGLTRDERARVMGLNALAFLGLDRRGPQYDRLAAHFGDHPAFRPVTARLA